MFERWSLKFPITLGVTMIILIIALIIGWVILTTVIALQSPQAGFYWALLSIGTSFLAIVLTGVVFYLTLSVKAINLTRRQSNFIDSVTHELKSPIASLKLYLQTLDIREVSEEERETFHRFMMDDVERLDNLITHLLEAGYADKVRSYDVEAIDLAEIIQQAVRSVTLRYRVDETVVKTDLQSCLINTTRVDAIMIFRNLIDNAVKYADQDPEVQITLKLEGDFAVCHVSDNGPGIPKKLRRKIFGRFVRLGRELRREKPGTGLGLYIVRTLVRRAGGKVTVLDEEDFNHDDTKMRTTFEVRLPATPVRSNSPTVETEQAKAVSLNAPA
ncbi:HAMP domain-containing histidine kinase [bacterium]|nr:HAMP domain-containing histidine kinase [bacterium]